MNNREVAEVFETIADMLEIQGEVIYKTAAYRRAADSILNLGRDINDTWREGGLRDIPGVGQAISEKIDELLRTGRLEFFERLRAQVPAGVVEMLRVPGVGPKKARTFYEQLGIASVDALAAAAQEGKLRDLPGMGAKSEARILAGIESLHGSRERERRVPLGAAWPVAMGLLAALREKTGIQQASVAGSLRRMRETIGDLDLLAVAEDAEAVIRAFAGLPAIERVLGSGPTKISVELHNGQQTDLRVIHPNHWGTALVYFTGSKAHNIKLRELALRRGLSLNEYAFTPIEGGPEVFCQDEQAVYAALGMSWIPPELREDRGEIEAALHGKLPHLIEAADIRGDLQMHTRWSDGQGTVLDMAQAARACGLGYILITDHSQSLGVAGGLTPERLRQQRVEIDAANAVMSGAVRVLQGAEVEIRADGSLDYPDEVLSSLDLVVASLHTGLRQPREQVTHRMLSAIRNPHVDIIAHPTGRLLGEREPADLDMDAVLQAAAETGTILEINADWHRLDLNDVYARRAVEQGVRLSISSDAHVPSSVGELQFGVAIARRGWVTAGQVVNAWPLERLLNFVKR